VSKERPTTTKQRLVGLAQHRHQQQLMRIDEEISEDVSCEEGKSIIELYKNAINDVDIVCLQDYAKGILSPSLTSQFISIARQAGKRVLVDPPLRDNYSKFTGASTMTPNRQEASLVVGFPIESKEDAERAASILLEKFELEAAIITMDKDGAYLKTSDRSMMVSTIARTVYDVTGAGDVVLAAMAVSLAGGWDYYDAVSLANIAGGLEVEKFGVATVSRDEIIAELIERCNEKTGKIANQENLDDVLGYHRAKNDTIVFTNGCFDVIHRGHIEYLQFSKKQGDILIVGLNSDRSVRENKGPTRPINGEADRAQVLAALECVDYVVIFDEATPVDIIPKVCPDILVKGEDWKDKGVVGREFVEARGGKVILARMVEGKSSTNIIDKMEAKE
jgi:D-beta-D-heptose 7-phosphate kinase/D-beta-D-heptose 1-phosphate adenosyltransferase